MNEAAIAFANDFIAATPIEDHAYLRSHFHRYVCTYSICPDQPAARVLDLGHERLYCAMLEQLKGYAVEPVVGLTFDFEADRFPYDDETFDGVMLCEVIEHFTEDPMHCMLEINRILKPGGFCVLSTPNCASWFAIHNALEHKHSSRYAHYAPDGRGVHSIHAREYLPSEVAALLCGAGLDVLNLFTANYDPQQCPRPIPGFSDHDRGETIFAMGRKVGLPRLRFIKECYRGIDVPFSEAIRYR